MKYRVGNKQSHEARCYASGGRVSEDISDPGSLPTMSKASDDEGMAGVDGGKAKPRLDRAGKKPSTTINITIGKGDQAGPMPVMPPPMPVAPPAPPMAPPMAGPPMPPPGMPPMGAGGPPMMRKHGGRVMKKADGGAVDEDDAKNALIGAGGSTMAEAARKALRQNTAPSMGRKDGGRVMDAGAGSGMGRLEKIGKK